MHFTMSEIQLEMADTSFNVKCYVKVSDFIAEGIPSRYIPLSFDGS